MRRCGAGGTRARLDADGFLFRAAYYKLDYSYDSRLGYSTWGTYWTGERDWINANESSNPYISDPCDLGTTCNQYGAPSGSLTQSSFQADMGYDLQQHGWPTMAAVTTLGLVNWSGQDIDHFISIKGWDPTDNKVTYTDTANDSRASAGSFVEGEPSFYSNALQGGRMSEKMVLW